MWRDFHTATAVGSDMYIFGGRGKLKLTLNKLNFMLILLVIPSRFGRFKLFIKI